MEVEAGREIKAGVRVRTPDRHQMQMVCCCPDELVSKDHPVRTVAAVVQRLDLSAFYGPIKAREGNVGRDATDPALLVALWLCGGVSVNYHLLSDFRVGYADALDQLFTQVITTLVDRGLVKVKRITQDGVRVRSNAGSGSFRREERLTQLLDRARRHVDELRRQVDDPEHAAAAGSRRQAARQRAASMAARSWRRSHGSAPPIRRRG